MLNFAADMGAIAKQIFQMYPDDSYTLGRGQTLHPLFLGHLEAPAADLIPHLQSKCAFYNHSSCRPVQWDV